MTTEESTNVTTRTAPGVGARAGLVAALGAGAARGWQRVESWLVRASDWLNPILVKETRQALKSRQFLLTFLLLLTACWVVTIVGVASIGPGIYYAAAGGNLLIWYYAILAFPLAVVVPYSAFRSLAAEREDNTYDMLSITTLKPRQIISGKLGSSIAQMAVYFSAVAPCLAFTYLLRGVDLPTIVVLLVYSFFGSLGLSVIGLLLATLSRQRYGQVFLSVLFIVGLFGALWAALGFAFILIFESYAVFGDWFWVASLALFTVFATTFALCFFAAAGMITFASENRSTPLRVVMLVQQACWIGWMAFAWITENMDTEVVLVMVMMAAFYWYAAGAILTSERPQMSLRVRRRLPKSFLGRAFLSWIYPGPAGGYLFVIANASAIGVMALLALAVGEATGRGVAGWPSGEQIIYLMFIGWGSLVAYLGVGLLIVSALRRVAAISMIGCVLVHVLLLAAGSGIPWTIQLMSVRLRYLDYTYLQLTNPFWTLYYVGRRGLPSDAVVLLLIVATAAICILLLNLPGVVRELRQVRIAPPPRVVADELERHPPPAARPTSPWDEDQ